MSTMPTKPAFVAPVDDPRRTFESAIAQIQGRRRPFAQTPIAVRPRTPLADDSAAEKRAVADAARALARLWKVSPAIVR
jgi:hypothetical protein